MQSYTDDTYAFTEPGLYEYRWVLYIGDYAQAYPGYVTVRTAAAEPAGGVEIAFANPEYKGIKSINGEPNASAGDVDAESGVKGNDALLIAECSVGNRALNWFTEPKV